jgi:long-chain acyl-CoA synthetase
MRASSTLDAIVARLAGFGGRPALVAFGASNRREWSYRELARVVDARARTLIAEGLAPGDPVALFAPDGPEWLIAALAVIRAGGVLVPLDAQFTDEPLAHALVDSAARLAFSADDRAMRVARLVPGLRLLRPEAADPDEDAAEGTPRSATPLPGRESTDPAAIFYTSGTTGPPKGVPLTHGSLAYQVVTLEAIGLVAPDDRVCLPLPLHHVYPFVVGALTPLALGLPLVLPAALTGPQILRALHEGDVTVVVGVPRLFGALLAAIDTQLAARGPGPAAVFRAGVRGLMAVPPAVGVRTGRALFRPLRARLGSRLRLLTSGGAALEPVVARKLMVLGWDVASGYGLTETSPLLTVNLPGSGRPTSAGRPVPGTALRVAPVSGVPAPQGEIQARGPGVFNGYLNLPERTRAAFTPDGWFRTGDLGHVDPAGFLYITGRIDEMLVTGGGENVEPESVEAAFQRHPFLREFALLQEDGRLVGLALPDLARIEQAGRADVVAAVREAVAAVNLRLPSYQRVVDVAITRDPLPRTRLGKLTRRALPPLYARACIQKSDDDGGAIPVEAMGEADRAVLDHPAAAAVWTWLARRYPDRRLTMDVSLGLDLGIDSLAWVNLGLEIERQAGVELDQAAVGRIATVRDLLHEVATAPGSRGASPATWWDAPERVLSAADTRWLSPLGPGQQVLSRALMRLNGWLVRGLFGLRTVGLEHVPDPPWVLVANHVSFLDPLALSAALGHRRLEGTYWGGWTGVAFANAPMRALSRLWRVLPVYQQRGATPSLALAAAALARGHSLIWFPEGERSRTGVLLPFRTGVGFLLHRFPRPVVPVHLGGTFEALSRGALWPRFRRITVRVGPPLDPARLAAPGTPPDAAARQIADGLHQAVAALGRPVPDAPAARPRTSPTR